MQYTPLGYQMLDCGLDCIILSWISWAQVGFVSLPCCLIFVFFFCVCVCRFCRSLVPFHFVCVCMGVSQGCMYWIFGPSIRNGLFETWKSFVCHSELVWFELFIGPGMRALRCPFIFLYLEVYFHHKASSCVPS